MVIINTEPIQKIVKIKGERIIFPPKGQMIVKELSDEEIKELKKNKFVIK